MKITKKLLTLVLAAMLLLSLAVPTMAADSDFYIQDGFLSMYTGAGGDVVIPDEVTEIGAAFFGYTSLTSVVIPSSVTKIGMNSFNGCTGLTSVTIPSSVTEIGYGAFYNCTNLKTATISEGVTKIGISAFSCCLSLTAVTIPASVTWIDEGAFVGCPSLTDINFGGTQKQWDAILQTIKKEEMEVFDRDNAITVHCSDSTGTSTAPEATTPPSFTDVPANAYYADAVKWAVDNEITKGTSDNTFSPDTTCNTAQILTFLWRACDRPDAPMYSFADVNESDYYYKPAKWAAHTGMVSEDMPLSPETPCTRASTVMFMWQAAGSPSVDTEISFTDVPADADYAMAVAWAVENGVTAGTSATTFSPSDTCTRGHIVTFLNRAFA